MKQTSVKGLPAFVSVAYLDKHSSLDPVMVSVVGSILIGDDLLLKLHVNSGVKCKCDLIVKNSDKNMCWRYVWPETFLVSVQLRVEHARPMVQQESILFLHLHLNLLLEQVGFLISITDDVAFTSTTTIIVKSLINFIFVS